MFVSLNRHIAELRISRWQQAWCISLPLSVSFQSCPYHFGKYTCGLITSPLCLAMQVEGTPQMTSVLPLMDIQAGTQLGVCGSTAAVSLGACEQEFLSGQAGGRMASFCCLTEELFHWSRYQAALCQTVPSVTMARVWILRAFNSHGLWSIMLLSLERCCSLQLM